MWSKIWHRLTTTLTGGAIIIAVASVLSRVLGLFRDRLLASRFGAGDTLDVYYAAFKVPDFVFNILVLGALSAAFIPVFVQYVNRSREGTASQNEHWHLANSMLNILLLGLVLFGAIFFILAPYLVPLISPGFTGEKQQLTISLTRIMLAAVIFFGASNIISGILNSLKRYLSFALAPVMYNLGIIIGIVFFVPQVGIFGLAWGVVLGAFLHLLVQIPGVLRVGFRYRAVMDMRHAGVRAIGRLMLPRTFGLAVNQVEQLVSLIIGSTLVAGSVAVFNLSSNLQYFPVNVVGVSLAVAAFPFFSEASAQNDRVLFTQHFSKSFRRILFLVIPISVVMLVLRAQIVRVVLGAGAFDWNDTYLTAQALGFFSLSLFAQAVIPLLTRSFYAWQDTKTPVKTAVVSLLINTVGAYFLSKHLGVIGLALAFSIASFAQMAILLFLLRKRIGTLDDRVISTSVLKILLISAVSGAVMVAAKYFLALGVDMHTFVGIFIQGVGAGVVGLLTYAVLAFIVRCDEIKILTDWLARAKRQFFNGKNGGPATPPTEPQ